MKLSSAYRKNKTRIRELITTGECSIESLEGFVDEEKGIRCYLCRNYSLEGVRRAVLDSGTGRECYSVCNACVSELGR